MGRITEIHVLRLAGSAGDGTVILMDLVVPAHSLEHHITDSESQFVSGIGFTVVLGITAAAKKQQNYRDTLFYIAKINLYRGYAALFDY